MSRLPTCGGLPNAISSPGSVFGHVRCETLDGPTSALSGREAAHANLSARRAKAPVQTIQGTCGPIFIASSPPADPLSSWESKLRERLGTGGSMEFELIWKELATPGGRSIFRLSRSTPRTFASGFIGSPQTWRTPTVGMVNADRSASPLKYAQQKVERGQTITLVDDVHLSTWPTPTTPSGGRTAPEGMTTTGVKPDGTKTQVTLEHVTRATWPTPRAGETCDQTSRPGFFQSLPNVVRDTEASGPTTSGSPDQTENRGALNPAFPCWLMGFPEEFLWCAPEKTGPKKRTPTTE